MSVCEKDGTALFLRVHSHTHKELLMMMKRGGESSLIFGTGLGLISSVDRHSLWILKQNTGQF